MDKFSSQLGPNSAAREKFKVIDSVMLRGTIEFEHTVLEMDFAIDGDE